MRIVRPYGGILCGLGGAEGGLSRGRRPNEVGNQAWMATGKGMAMDIDATQGGSEGGAVRGIWARQRRFWLLLFFVISLTGLILICASSDTFAQEEESSLPVTIPNEPRFTRSTVCGTCHFQIYRNWKRSMHAQSVEDPIFSLAYMESYLATAGGAKKLCLQCHAPAVQLNADFEMKETVTKEGVTCDFCHSVEEVTQRTDGNRVYGLSVGNVKRGPWTDSTSPVHGTIYSPLHTKAELCAGCHEYTTPSGVPLLGTYTEWSKGPYAEEGVQCQDCHMPRAPGHVVRSGVAAAPREFINLHEVRGGHSVDQLRKALELEVRDVRREGERLTVDIEIRNVGAGHMVPTGWPRKKVVLVAEVITAEGEIFRQERVYQKVLADGSGQPIERDSEVVTRAEIVLMDNRLGPRETRQETFDFRVPSETRVVVRASVSYEYEPLLAQTYPIHVEMSAREVFLESE